ncbi:Oidioi.mRNA.OKI2018_I69.XSR.g15046.t1.cds [Oikopleura dioica]|uniref:Oidioi.mRNA.OKI2018_I69.XSR.g15046.t1.cds n=1 Tax=Oikopleura dioica TaxID=34765 RepID=A0ABN7SDC8_OIKDI|nr:Oidioi.mRNA.OKI2018_I69.XSR.g15046.t1.cds [Oikopleura dioica]
MAKKIKKMLPDVRHHVCIRKRDLGKALSACEKSLELSKAVAPTCTLDHENDFDERDLVPPEDCIPKKQIFFLKTSKTGSTTVAQIIARFSYNNQLKALFGEDSSGNLLFANRTRPFNANDCYLGRDLPVSQKFDASFVHLRYDRDEVRKVMKPGFSAVSILPSPHEFLDLFGYESLPSMFLMNHQFYFFGYPSVLLRSKEKTEYLADQWIEKISEEFDLVLIMEEMLASLAIFMLKFCWTSGDMIHFKLNSNPTKKPILSAKAKSALQELIWADFKLYNHFKDKLHSHKEYFGVKGFVLICQELTLQN